MPEEFRKEKFKKRNILLLINSISGGGAELVVANLCKHLNRNLFNISVCHLKERGQRGQELVQLGYDVIGLPEAEIFKNKYLSFIRLRKLMKEKRIDLIHSHDTGGLVDSSQCKILNRKIKLVHTFHFGNYPHLNKKDLRLERIFYKSPDKLIAVGDEQRKAIKSTFRMGEDKIVTIWNGIEIGNENEIAKGNNQNGYVEKIKIGSISTLIEQKGINYLIDAIKIMSGRINNFHVLIVGDGPLRKELENKTKKLGLGGIITFMGWVHNASQKILPHLDIFVQSSLWEAMSIVVLEAMAAGKPVLVTDVGENRHIIESGKNGLIVQKKDIEKLAQEMERLTCDRKLRDDLGREARMTVVEKCSVQEMARNYERLYLDILGTAK